MTECTVFLRSSHEALPYVSHPIGLAEIQRVVDNVIRKLGIKELRGEVIQIGSRIYGMQHQLSDYDFMMTIPEHLKDWAVAVRSSIREGLINSGVCEEFLAGVRVSRRADGPLPHVRSRNHDARAEH